MLGHSYRSLVIASSAGGFKGVFVHGVLSALEAADIRADAYAAASSSVFPSISAAIGMAEK
jgi:predicted acylesterase/phospholipase RssA